MEQVKRSMKDRLDQVTQLLNHATRIGSLTSWSLALITIFMSSCTSILSYSLQINLPGWVSPVPMPLLLLTLSKGFSRNRGKNKDCSAQCQFFYFPWLFHQPEQLLSLVLSPSHQKFPPVPLTISMCMATGLLILILI